jgi:hypothetical protein
VSSRAQKCGGKASSHHVANVTAATIRPIIMNAVSRETRLPTDEHQVYGRFGWRFAETVAHAACFLAAGERGCGGVAIIARIVACIRPVSSSL